MGNIVSIIIGIIAFFIFIAIPLVFIISAISIASGIVIGVPFIAVVVGVILIVRMIKKKKKQSPELSEEITATIEEQ